MPANLSDSSVSEKRKPKVSGIDAMYDIATGHNIGSSSIASSEFHCESSAEQLKRENKQLRMTINTMGQDMELEVARVKETTRNEMLQVHKQEMAI